MHRNKSRYDIIFLTFSASCWLQLLIIWYHARIQYIEPTKLWKRNKCTLFVAACLNTIRYIIREITRNDNFKRYHTSIYVITKDIQYRKCGKYYAHSWQINLIAIVCKIAWNRISVLQGKLGTSIVQLGTYIGINVQIYEIQFVSIIYIPYLRHFPRSSCYPQIV